MLAVLFSLVFFIQSASAERMIAILDFRCEAGQEKLCQTFTEEARTAAARALSGTDVVLMDRENMMQLMSDMGKDCSQIGGQCEVELGRSIGAHFIISARHSRLDEALILHLKIHETGRGKPLHASKLQSKSKLGLNNQIAKATKELLRHADPEEKAADFEVKQKALVRFESEPPGAKVSVGGFELCQTPCQKAVPHGSHLVTMHLKRHRPEAQTIEIGGPQTIRQALKSLYGVLKVQSEPAGLRFRLDKAAHAAPKSIEHKGPYSISVDDPCLRGKTVRGVLKEGERKTIRLKATPRQAGLSVDVSDAKGNAVAVELLLDGEKLGQTPFAAKVPLCAKNLLLKGGKGQLSKNLKLSEGQTESLSFAVSAFKAARANQVDKAVFERRYEFRQKLRMACVVGGGMGSFVGGMVFGLYKAVQSEEWHGPFLMVPGYMILGAATGILVANSCKKYIKLY